MRATPGEDEEKVSRLAAALDAYERAKAEGTTPARIGETTDILTPEDMAELAKARSVVDMLHRHFPASRSSDDNGETAPIDLGVFGRFELKSELGRGGFGVVFLARDPVIRRDIALKIPSARVFLNEEARRRCLREAEAAGRLNHPNIVRVLEAGEIDSSVYVAFEYIEGPNLSKWLRGRTEAVPIELAAEWAFKLASAAGHAHERGVLHRDLKPANVILEQSRAGRENSFEPKLTDFGLARLADAIEDETRSGAILGTPKYMAPEQAAGGGKRVGPEADVYSIGVILYELLAGRTPFIGETDYSTFQQVMNDEPVSPRRLRPSVPADLDTICLKCLQKKPADRYANANELSLDLRRYLDNLPIVARPTSRMKKAVLWTRRRPSTAAMLGLTLLFAAIAVAGVWNYQNSLRAQRDELQQKNLQLLRHQYATDLKSAYSEWEEGRLPSAQSLLARFIPKEGEEDIRGFDWWWLRERCCNADNALLGHEGHVYHVEFAPDGKSLVSAGVDGSVRLWDFETRKETRRLRGHQGEVNWASFSPDGKSLVSVGDDKTAIVWNVADGKQRLIYRGHSDEVVAALFTPDGKRVVSGGRGGAIHVWDVASGRKNHEIKTKIARIDYLGMHSGKEGVLVAAVGEPPPQTAPIVEIWNIDQPAPAARVIALGKTGAKAAEFAPSGDFLFTAGEVMECIPLSSNSKQPYPYGGGEHASTLAISPNGHRLVTAGSSIARLRRTEDREVEKIYRGNRGQIWSTRFHPDGDHFATGGEDGAIRIWSANEFDDCEKVPLSFADVRHDGIDVKPRFATDDRSLYCGLGTGVFHINVLAKSAEKIVPIGNVHTFRYAVAQRKPVLAATGGDGAIAIWDLARKQEIREIRFPVANGDNQVQIQTPVLSPDGDLMTAPNGRERFGVWSLPSGRLERSFGKSSFPNFGGACWPDGNRLLLLIGPEQFFLHRSTLTLEPASIDREWIFSLQFSRAGDVFAVGHLSSAAIHSTDDFAQRSQVMVRPRVQCIALAPDGRTLATADAKEIQFWSVSTGEPTFALKVSAGNVEDMIFTPDGTTLAAYVRNDKSEGELLLFKKGESTDRFASALR